MTLNALVTDDRYGEYPTVIDNIELSVDEMMFYQDMPIKLAGQPYNPRNKDDRLAIFDKLISTAILDFEGEPDYIYICAKRLFCTPDNVGNRAGYHCDGFLSDDTNYVWSDIHPTVFCVQPYVNVYQDHIKSLPVFDEQSKPENELTMVIPFDLVRLTPFVVHRTPTLPEAGFRTFVKITFSKHRFNLIGNSHNQHLSYDWEMHPREKVRNHPVFNEVNFLVGSA